MKTSTLRISTMVLVALLAVLLSACPPPGPGPDGGGNGGMDNGNVGAPPTSAGLPAAPNVTDAMGKQGVWKEVTGSITEQGSYVNGEKQGLWTVYQSGTLDRTEVYLNDQLHGPQSRIFDSNGNPLLVINYQNGQTHGLVTQYFSRNPDRKMTESTHVNGVLQGTSKTWIIDSKGARILTIFGEYAGGKRTGEWQEWFYNGTRTTTNLISSGMYAGGFRTGSWRVVVVNEVGESSLTCTPPTDGSAPPKNPGKITDDSTCVS